MTITRTPRRFVGLLALAGALAGPAVAQTSIAPAVRHGARGVAHVSVLFRAGSSDVVRVERASSGIVLDPSGLVLTNDHLVEEIEVGGGAPGGEFWLQVVIGGGRPCAATVLARDERLDLALLQLELEGDERIAALELAPDLAPRPGAKALGLGLPRGGHRYAFAGVVALPNGPAALRDGNLERDEALLCDAALLDNVDGGPLIDSSGRVFGIVNTSSRLTEEPDPEDEEKPDYQPDYTVIVRARAIRSAFPDELGGNGVEAPTEDGEEEVTAALVEAIGDAVVSVWAGAADARPEQSAPNDPHGLNPEPGLGSGVVVDPLGLVLTNAAAVGEATEVSVRLLDGSTHVGDVLSTKPEGGAALVRLRLPEGVSLKAAELGSSDAALSGEVIAVVGNPYGHTSTVSAGVLSALEAEGRLRVGAWVHDGQRGGALVDGNGRLIGIPAADIHEGEEPERPESYLGVAVPIDRVREWFAAELEQYGSAPGLRAAPEASEADVERRRNKITAIVDATRDSLLNVEVKAEVAKSAAFDPFGTRGEFTLLGQGSGVVIDDSGLALTNWHVVDAALGEDGGQREDRSVEVTLPSGKRYSARVLSTSRDDDLGLIQLELAEGDVVYPVTLGSSRKLSLGDVVAAIGNPFGKANTVTSGIVAAKNKDTKIRGRLHIYEGMLQTDAAINPGNSGGALLDIDGQLVGINSAGSSGVGLAIPVERVREVFGEKLLSTRELRSAELGMSVADGDDADAVVRTVEPHGPAARAGVEVGDRVLRIDGEAMESAVDYGRVMLGARPGVALHMELARGGDSLTLDPVPISHTAWRIFLQTGIELSEVDYRTETTLVRDASVELYRAYTGIADGLPNELMSGALRVVQVAPREGATLEVQPGDLLLGAKSTVRSFDSEHTQLVPFPSLAALRNHLEPLATKKGHLIECWLLRAGAVETAAVTVYRVR